MPTESPFVGEAILSACGHFNVSDVEHCPECDCSNPIGYERCLACGVSSAILEPLAQDTPEHF